MSSNSGNQRRSGLGRGLGALIPAPAPSTSTTGPLEIAIELIEPNPYQPRSAIDQGKLHTLAESIRQHGIIQPLVVREMEPGRYFLIAGERRWRAAQLAGLTSVPIILKDATPRAQLELALVENVVRADLSPLEEAAAYRQLIEEFGLTQGEVAERVGRSRVSVTNTLRLLTAPDAVQAALNSGHITEGHARALLGLPSAADQIAMLDVVIAKGWTVRQTEDAVRRWLTEIRERATETPKPIDHESARLEDQFRSALGTRVSLKRDGAGGAGSLTIHFFSEDDLQGIYDRIVGDDPW
jgi:ParB family chromosome partitioning protein